MLPSKYPDDHVNTYPDDHVNKAVSKLRIRLCVSTLGHEVLQGERKQADDIYEYPLGPPPFLKPVSGRGIGESEPETQQQLQQCK